MASARRCRALLRAFRRKRHAGPRRPERARRAGPALCLYWSRATDRSMNEGQGRPVSREELASIIRMALFTVPRLAGRHRPSRAADRPVPANVHGIGRLTNRPNKRRAATGRDARTAEVGEPARRNPENDTTQRMSRATLPPSNNTLLHRTSGARAAGRTSRPLPPRSRNAFWRQERTTICRSRAWRVSASNIRSMRSSSV